MNYMNNHYNLNNNYNINNINPISSEQLTSLNEEINFLDNEDIYLTFSFINHQYNKPIYINIKKCSNIHELIFQLEDKYSWMKLIKNKSYYFQNKEINNLNISVNKLGLSNDSNIIIKIKDK